MGKHKKLKAIFDQVMDFIENITENHIFAYASQASFFVVISSVPFLMIVLNIFQAVTPISQDTLYEIADNFLPMQIQNFAAQLITEFSSKVSVSLISVTTIFLIWSASRGVKAIAYGLKMAYGTNGVYGYFKSTLWSLVYTLLFMVGVIVSVVLMLFGKTTLSFLNHYIPDIIYILEGVLNLRWIIAAIYLTLVFMTAYKFLGKSKMRFHRQFVGAFGAALTWILFSYFYSLYIENLSNFSVIYGSLAAIIFLMLWVWFCMIFLLFGGQVNVWLYDHNISFFGFLRRKLKRNKTKQASKN